MGGKELTGNTGSVCRMSGVYACINGTHGEITIAKGEVFPVCPFGKHAAVWVLKEKTSGEKK